MNLRLKSRLRLPELGGGRLGAPGEAQPIPATSAPAEGPSVGERIGETAASAGKYVGEAASSVGESLSGMGSWVRKSVTSLGGSEEKKEPKKEAFKAFEGLRGFWWLSDFGLCFLAVASSQCFWK